VVCDSSLDCWIELDPDVGWIAPKMLWIDSPVGVRRFAEFREKWPVTV